MNQILATKKVYVTPELKRKKRLFKFEFFLSVFFICLLFSYYIYAEYDKNKNEDFSKEILASAVLEIEQDNTTVNEEDNDMLVVILSEEEIEEVATSNQELENNPIVTKTPSGLEYSTIGIINIPKINVNYPIISETSDAYLKISPCKFWGPEPNEVGNFCIVGHNYRNKKFFSKVPTLENGDIIEITDLSSRTIKYEVYDKYIVDPTNVECSSQLTNGRKDVTLITCTNDNLQRHIIKARECQ